MTAEAIEAASIETYSVAKYKRGGKFVCWYTRIGYSLNSKGVRVRAWQYHGKDYAAAQRAALDLAAQREIIVADYKKRKAYCDHWHRQAIASATLDGYYLDENDNKVEFAGTEAEVNAYRQRLQRDPSYPALPVWPKEEKASQPQPVNFTLSPSQKTVELKVVGITIAQAKEKYFADYRNRVGLQSEAGLKDRTVKQHETTLKIALKAVDETAPLNALDTGRIEAVAHYWGSPERGLSRRTASNYTQAFWQFLLRLPALKVGFVFPDDIDKRLFKFTKVKGKVEKYDKVQLKTLLNALDDECKLYQLLGLQCGFYQVDICNLGDAEIVTIEKDTYIVRKRDKTSHQNDFTSQWWLFPETARLLKKCRAKRNPKGLALLRPDLTPMGRVGNSDDWVTVRFNKAKEAAGAVAGDFTFKQFRKIGYSAIKRLTMSKEVARMYAAKVVTDAEYDRDDFFEPLTDALKKWHDQLKADKVL